MPEKSSNPVFTHGISRSAKPSERPKQPTTLQSAGNRVSIEPLIGKDEAVHELEIPHSSPSQVGAVESTRSPPSGKYKDFPIATMSYARGRNEADGLVIALILLLPCISRLISAPLRIPYEDGVCTVHVPYYPLPFLVRADLRPDHRDTAAKRPTQTHM